MAFVISVPTGAGQRLRPANGPARITFGRLGLVVEVAPALAFACRPSPPTGG
jgi:hypothetical protein